MPKRVPEETKRVPLNCLVLPKTLAFLKSADGSQGAVVDRAVAALRSLPPPFVDGVLNQGRGNQEAGVSFRRTVEHEISVQQRPFKPPLLKPKDKKK